MKLRTTSHWLRFLVPTLAFAFGASAQTATWTGSSGGDWNTAANWDLGAVPGPGTNALIPASTTVNYTSHMDAASFGQLSLLGTLNISAAGFTLDRQGSTSAALAIATNASMTVGASGYVLVTNAGPMWVTNAGTLTLSGSLVATNSAGSSGLNVGVATKATSSKGAVVTINTGGVLTLDKQLSIAGTGGRVTVNSGGTLNCLGGSRVYDTQLDTSPKIAVDGGVANLGDFSVYRCDTPSGSGLLGGLLLSNGVVNATSIQIGTGNSMAFSGVYGGVLTNTGAFTISDTGSVTATGDRRSQFYVRGGTIVSTGSDGIILGNQSGLSATPAASGGGLGGVLNMSSGTVIAEKLTLIKDNTISNAYAGLFLSGGTVYLGSGGLVLNTGAGHVGYTVGLSGGTLAAKSDWSSSAKLALTNTMTFKAADAAGAAHNIALSGVLSGTGKLTKTGDGVLTLSGANTFTGGVNLAAGTLVQGRSGAVPTGSSLTLGASGTAGVLDLAGYGLQVSSLALGSGAAAANQWITNSSTTSGVALVFSNSASSSSSFGGSIVEGAAPIALTIQNGSLTLFGTNTYSGATTINQGALALGASASLGRSQTLIVGTNSNARLDVSGVSGFALQPGTVLSGYGVVTGAVAAAGCALYPGAVGVAGCLSFSNSLALNGVTNFFDLALDPSGTGNDQLVVAGALNFSGVNVIQVNPLSGTLLIGTYKLVQFGSLGSGGSGNLALAGNIGNGLQAVLKVTATGIDLVVSQGEGDSFVWQGDGGANLWDTTSANWLLGIASEVFTNGSFVAFNDSSENTVVNLAEPLSPAAVTVDASVDYTFAGGGKLTGPISLSKTNTGTLYILTTNDYAGVTAIQQGRVQVGNGVVSGSLGSGSLVNDGSLVFALPDNRTLSNVVSGAGTLCQVSASTLTLAASNSYTGGTGISAGALQVATGGALGSGPITNQGQLIFNSASNLTVADAISGSGSLVLAGSGAITLNGNNTFAGGVSVNKGTLVANSTSGSATGLGAVAIASGARLTGAGTIGGPTTVNSGGILAPGNPFGTLSFNNSLTLSTGTVMIFALGTDAASAAVAGDLALNGILNITNLGTLGNSTNTLFTYAGKLTLGTVTFGTTPAGRLYSLDTTNSPGKVNLVVGVIATNVPAFPGALGFASGVTGGRGGSVYHVTTLADSGTGSFRDAVSVANRIVIFDVGGYINLASAVSVKKNITIAGQTAPGGGIGFAGGEISFASSSNIVCRYIRVRPGDNTASSEDDALSLYRSQNVIVDHSSVEFAPWNNIDGVSDDWQNYPVTAITFQNCIIANPTGQQFGAHTECVNGTWSWFNNVFANSHNRNPLAKENTVFINNVLYNYSAGYTTHTSTEFSHDIVSNYFIMGPASLGTDNTWFQMDNNQSIYYSGNLKDTDLDGTLDGSITTPYWYQGGGTVLSSPWCAWTASVPMVSPAVAYRRAVSQAGPLPRDPVDALVISQMQTLGYGTVGTGTGTAGPDGGLYTSQTQTGLDNSGYGTIASGTAPTDTDGDGLPDYWENAMGLNPTNANDATNYVLSGYQQIEVYVNWLASPHAIAPGNSYVEVDLWPWTAGFTNGGAYGIAAATNGTAVLLADQHTVRFTPATGFCGIGGFGYTATDSAGNVMKDAVSMLVTKSTRTAPVFSAPIANTNFTINAGVALRVTNVAVASGSSTVTYSSANLPPNAVLDSSSGVFSWRPSASQAGTSNQVTVMATDDGSPSLSSSQSFSVVVNTLTKPSLAAPQWPGGVLSLTVNGQTGPDYIISASTNLVDWVSVCTNTSPAMPFQWSDPDAGKYPARFYRVSAGP
jgi:autotransporter-associated beta strand protein